MFDVVGPVAAAFVVSVVAAAVDSDDSSWGYFLNNSLRSIGKRKDVDKLATKINYNNIDIYFYRYSNVTVSHFANVIAVDAVVAVNFGIVNSAYCSIMYLVNTRPNLNLYHF